MVKLRILEKDEQAYKNMEAVCAIMNALCNTGNTEYWVGETWFDYGAGIRWTTIINNHQTQILYPVDYERIVTATTAQELAVAVDKIRNGKYFREK